MTSQPRPSAHSNTSKEKWKLATPWGGNRIACGGFKDRRGPPVSICSPATAAQRQDGRTRGREAAEQQACASSCYLCCVQRPGGAPGFLLHYWHHSCFSILLIKPIAACSSHYIHISLLPAISPLSILTPMRKK